MSAFHNDTAPGHSEQKPKQASEPGEAEEEEPRLKYQRLGSDVTELLGKNAATCLCVSDKILALGTSSGTVHILDYSGNEVGSDHACKTSQDCIVLCDDRGP